MVTKDYYQEKIMWASMLLNGKLLPSDQAKYIYERIKDRYTNSDLSLAIESIVDENDKLTYSNIISKLNYYRSLRIENYIAKKKKEEEAEVKSFWQSHGETNCAGGECYKCNVLYCETIKNETVAAIKRILAKESTATDENKRLAGKFVGIGFEAEMPELQPF